jgi:hypothetical protein
MFGDEFRYAHLLRVRKQEMEHRLERRRLLDRPAADPPPGAESPSGAARPSDAPAPPCGVGDSIV